ncbi:hypothetical protein TruAng_004889 [Truncatella angustata]|nr:hypothetical protein TruAng_004889 [Truncatella angustata]
MSPLLKIAGERLLWRQSVTCITDDSSGEYCNTEFQDAANGTGSSKIGCSQCYLDYLYTIADSEYGKGIVSESYFEERAAACSATSYSFMHTATATTTSTVVSATSNARCNMTDTDTIVYEVQAGDSCISISAAQNVSTGLLASTNALNQNCTYLTIGQNLCLPESCEVYMVQQNDTCDSIVDSLTREVTATTFISWNTNLNSQCLNIASLMGTYICISPPGTASIPSYFPLMTATTAVAVPTNAVTTSNTDCGYWYTIESGDECEDIVDAYGISLDDFYFLNPQLGGSCSSLWLGNAYCVEAVGSIKTYSGYNSTTSSRNYTTLGSTIDTISTRTVNRTTTHFFYSWPAVTTTTVTFNSTVASILADYNLCSSVLAYYDLSEDDDLSDEAYGNDEWMDEYERVCVVDPDALPTVAFNTAIALNTTTSATTGATATAGTATLTETSTSTSATATGLSISLDGTCGYDTSYTCSGSSFGDCCSIYGYCCNESIAAATATATTASAAASSISTISPDGTCGEENGYTCAGSEFGDCCSIYGYCGSTADYCSTNCDSSFGTCDA